MDFTLVTTYIELGMISVEPTLLFTFIGDWHIINSDIGLWEEEFY